MHLIVRFLLILIMLLPAGYGVYSLYRQREIATMEGRNEELLKINRALQKDHQRLAGSVKTKGELESWEIRLKAKEETLSNEVVRVEQLVRDANLSIDHEQERLQRVERSVETAEKRRRKVDDDIVKAEETRASLVAKNESLRKELDQLRVQVSDTNALLKALSTNVITVDANFKAASNRLAGVNHEIDMAVERRISELQDLQKQKGRLDGEILQLKTTVQNLILQTNQLHRVVVKESGLAAEARQRKIDAASEADRADLSAEQARRRERQAKDDEQKARSELQTVEDQVAEVSHRLDELKADEMRRKTEINRLAGQVSSFGTVLEGLQNNVSATNTLSQEIVRLKDERRGVEADLRRIADRRDNLKTEVLLLEDHFNRVESNLVRKIQVMKIPTWTNAVENVEGK